MSGIERRLAKQPPIKVPTIGFDGLDDGVRPPAGATQHSGHVVGLHVHRLARGVGHDMPQEPPQVFADTVVELVHGR